MSHFSDDHFVIEILLNQSDQNPQNLYIYDIYILTILHFYPVIVNIILYQGNLS